MGSASLHFPASHPGKVGDAIWRIISLCSYALSIKFQISQLLYPSMFLLSVLCSFSSSENKSAYYPLPIVRLLHLESFRSVVIFIFLSLWFFFVTFFFSSSSLTLGRLLNTLQSMTDRSHHDTYIVDGCPVYPYAHSYPTPLFHGRLSLLGLSTHMHIRAFVLCLPPNEHHHHPTHGSHTPTNT